MTGPVASGTPVRSRECRTSTMVLVLAGALGAALLAVALHSPDGGARLYWSSAALAVLWLCCGTWYLRRCGQARRHEPLPTSQVRLAGAVRGVVGGALLAGVFAVGAVVVRQVEALREPVNDVLAHARRGSGWATALVTVAAGIAEEVFYRGAVYTHLPPKVRVVGSIGLYVAVTLAAGNVMLGFAALVLGAVVTLVRRASGTLVAPVALHVTWSSLMLAMLPRILPAS